MEHYKQTLEFRYDDRFPVDLHAPNWLVYLDYLGDPFGTLTANSAGKYDWEWGCGATRYQSSR